MQEQEQSGFVGPATWIAVGSILLSTVAGCLALLITRNAGPVIFAMTALLMAAVGILVAAVQRSEIISPIAAILFSMLSVFVAALAYAGVIAG